MGKAKAKESFERELVACYWRNAIVRPNNDYRDPWQTDCGHSFRVEDNSGPSDVGMQYCCFCGNTIIEDGVAYEADEPV